MKFGLFYELQVPRPWDDGSDERTINEALEQIELADRLGFHCVWAVEHHFLEEHSHCSAPEVFLAAAAARTKEIRLGHGIVAALPGYNHPVRIVERAAMLDLVSGGRVELGTGETGSSLELGGFLIDEARKFELWDEVIGELPRMFVEEPYGGHEGPAFSMPVRNVIPKPKQKPHPPLWGACTQPWKIPIMAHKGLGVLAFGLTEPERAKEWVDAYYEALASDDVVPVGWSINPNTLFQTGFFCAESEQEAIEKGIDGHHFFHFSLSHWIFNDHRPGRTNIWADFEAHRDDQGLSRSGVVADGKALSTGDYDRGQEYIGVALPEGRQKLMRSMDRALRGAIGTPDQIRDYVRRWEDAGADQVSFAVQSGKTKHEDICESLELFGRKVLPEFLERDEQLSREKAKRLEPIIERALRRRPPDREIPEAVVPPRDAYKQPREAPAR
jgi:alkanesulfonate monooxygenase SsuD/methylene tetrahydromethanopterin reductase-like flavin-dependent oxidoreductase (luciferase family)